MKKLAQVTLALLATALLHGGDDSGYKSESKSMTEVFTSKILKVYSFQEENHQYVAYVVTWKDHEVVVSPLGAVGGADKYKVGDTIRCQMQQLPARVGDENKSLITFSIMYGSGTTVDAARMEAVSQEVERRRAEREARAKSQGQPTAP